MRLAINIEWDTDGNEESLKTLPQAVVIPNNIPDDDVSDYLSDAFGYCHFGFELRQM